MRRAALAVLAGLAAPPAAAVEVGGLYHAETIVTGTEEPERTRGLRIGLADVVVKLTGDARLAEDPRLAPLLERSHDLVAGFEYEDRLKGIPIHDEQGTRERPHFLRMDFEPAAVDAALDRLGLARWPADRPLVAVWLGVETARGRYLLRSAGEEGYGQRAVLLETAARRGIPVALPGPEAAGDGIGFEDVAFGRLGRLASAGAADARLLGILSLDAVGYWDIRWALYRRSRTAVWGLRGVTFDTAIRNGLQRSALILSGRP